MRIGAVLALSSAALALAASASAALFVTFEPAEADVGDTVTIRLGGTGTGSGTTAADGGPAITVFLVREDAADGVRDPGDPRLTQVATIVPDENGRGVARFTVPDLPDGIYWPAYYCPGCAEFSGGDSFFAGSLDEVAAAYQGRVALTIGGGGGGGMPRLGWFVLAGALGGLVAALVVGGGRRLGGRGAVQPGRSQSS